MTWEILILVFAVLSNLLLAFLVYLRNAKSATHRLFSILTIAISAWSIINYFAVNSHENPAATWLVRLVMFSSTPLGVFFFLLVHTFPRSTLGLSRRNLFILLGLMVLTMGTALTPLLFPVVTPMPDRAPQPQPGIGMALYVPVVIFSIIYGIYLLIRKTIKARGLEKVQTSYLLMGVVIMFALIISLNFVAVTVFKTTFFTSFGPLFTLPFTLLASYTIARHRLMDIRLALLRVLSFSLLIGAFLFIYGLLLIFAVPQISNLTGLPNGVVAGATALLSIPVATVVRNILRRLTDRFLFQRQTNYRVALVTIGQKLSRTIQIDEVTKTVLQALRDIVRSRRAIIFLQEEKNGPLALRASYGAKLDVSVPRDNMIIKHLRHADRVIVNDELLIMLEEETRPAHRQELEAVRTAMDWLDASVILPLFIDKGIIGFIVLGEKLSGQPYLQEDVEFLAALAPQAATALENARLYQESLEFGQHLREEVKRATGELEIANVQLKELDRAKSEFLSIASHQLYTPLTAIRGYLSMLKEGDFGSLEKKQAPIIDIVNKSAERLIDLIKNLLDISRIESGRFELNLEVLDLARMAKEIVQDLLPNAMNKKLKLVWHDPPAPVPPVVADQARLRQVVLNFIDNAIKYTNRGHIDVTIASRGDTVEFMVTDTGRGLSKEEIPTLFTKFTRAGGASRYHTEGTGLGLYVARQIIREHRGEVSVTSPGKEKGSTFSIRMPAEGSPKSLKVGDKATVTIKAAPTTAN